GLRGVAATGDFAGAAGAAVSLVGGGDDSRRGAARDVGDGNPGDLARRLLAQLAGAGREHGGAARAARPAARTLAGSRLPAAVFELAADLRPDLQSPGGVGLVRPPHDRHPRLVRRRAPGPVA